jgi:hypothetical protein
MTPVFITAYRMQELEVQELTQRADRARRLEEMQTKRRVQVGGPVG